MTDKFRIFQRASRIWYLENRETRHQTSLRTKNQTEAKRLLHAKNEAEYQPAINLQIARAYLFASDPKFVTRTWQEVMECIVSSKEGSNRDRWVKAVKDRSFNLIRHLKLMEMTMSFTGFWGIAVGAWWSFLPGIVIFSGHYICWSSRI